MATDDEYMAFLEKANRDPNEGYEQPGVAAAAAGSGSGSKGPFKNMDKGAEVPEAIAAVTGKKKELFYTSDADEPFEPVVLGWDEAGKSLPDEGWLTDPSHLPFPP